MAACTTSRRSLSLRDLIFVVIVVVIAIVVVVSVVEYCGDE